MPRLRRPHRYFLAAAALAALVWLGLGRTGQAVVAPAAPAASSAPGGRLQLTATQWDSLKVEPVARVQLDTTLLADGIVSASDSASVAVYSPFSGHVATVPARLGQTVQRGATLATVLASELAQADSDLAAASAAASTAHTQLELALATEHRQQELHAAGAGAQKDWRQSQSDLVAAENAYQAAEAARVSAQAKLGILGPRGVARGPGLGAIVAPIDGVVAQRQVAPGQFVASLASGGAAALFTITDLRTVWIVANVAEADAAALKIGQNVDVSALALPQRSWHTRVNWIAAAVDPATHRIAVRAELPNADLALKPQMTVSARLHLGEPRPALSVPRSAVFFDGPQARCYVVVGERTLAARNLTLGQIDGASVEIRSGLTSADSVVTRGALFVDRAAEDDAS